MASDTNVAGLVSNSGNVAALQPLFGQNWIAVASGKGGVGKTWISITLCHTLAKAGRRVLLFDGDLGLANVDIQLGLTPDKDLGAVISGQTTMAGAVTHYGDGGFDIIAGRSGSGSLATLQHNHLSELRGQLLELSRNYNHALLDLGAGVDRTVRLLAGPAALTLVVVTDEPTSITDAYAYVKLTKAANPDADVRILVNMAANRSEGEKTYDTIVKACQNFLGFTPPLAGIIRRDVRVREAIRAQTPILVRSPGTEAASDMEALVRNLFSSPS